MAWIVSPQRSPLDQGASPMIILFSSLFGWFDSSPVEIQKFFFYTISKNLLELA